MDLFDDIKPDNLWDSIRYKYWDIVPYDYRPSHIWYKLKCWAWKRHTTIKPRFLGHTWCDKTELIVHINFEILCKFIEDECSPGYVDWEHDEEHRQIRQDLQNLYDWWIDCWTDRKEMDFYLDKTFDQYRKVLGNFIENEEDGPWKHIPEKDASGKILHYRLEMPVKDELKHRDYVLSRAKLDDLHDQFINNQLKKLIDLRIWMWT